MLRRFNLITPFRVSAVNLFGAARFCATTTCTSSLETLRDPLATTSTSCWSQDRFKRNCEFTSKASAAVTELVEQIRVGLPENEKARKLHLSRNKLLVRDRVNGLLDSGTSFFELSPLAAHGVYGKEHCPCAGIVTGIGSIMGTRCVIMANDATVKGGTYYPVSAKKQLRAQKIAQQNRLPCVYLVDSGGGNLERQAEGFADEQHFGRLFYNQANMSALGIPQVSVVMGSCTAGGAYIPCMSDETIIVKKSATIFLGGAQLVFAATGEVVSPEELGGGEMHCTVSGVADHLADNDAQALQMCRRVVKNLVRRERTLAQIADGDGAAPLFDTSTIAGFVDPIENNDIATEEKVNTKGVLSRLVDRSAFDEFKGLYGTKLTCGFAEISGITVGIVADNGSTEMGEMEALKGTHFVQMCSQRKVPMLFLHGGGCFADLGASGGATDRATKGSKMAAAKHAAKFISAVATSSNVPKITVVLRGSVGDGNFALCGRSMEPRFMFLWPTAKLALQQHLTASRHNDEDGGAENTVAPPMDALFSTARIFDDGIIAPESTRAVVAEALRCCLCASGEPGKLPDTKYGVFRM